MSFLALLAAADSAALKTLGESVTYSPSVGSPVTVTGIYDETSLHVDLGRPGVDSSGPRVTFRLADLPENPSTVGTLPTVTIRGVAFKVRDVNPDGQGVVQLLLQRVI